jgi:hypothetical protein
VRKICLIVCLDLVISVLAACADEEIKYPIFRHDGGYGNTNVWFVTKSRLEKLPVWKEAEEEPPLQVGKAISLAKTWVLSKGASTNCYVGTLTFSSLGRSSLNDKYHYVYFYIIQFDEVAQFGSHMTCVVLLDGSIVEPENIGERHKFRLADYLD